MLTNFEKILIWDTPVTLIDNGLFINEVISLAKTRSQNYICVSAVHNIVESYFTKRHWKALNGAIINTADGKPVALLASILSNKKQEPVSGCDFTPVILEECAKHNISIAVFGGSQAMLNQFKNKVNSELPTLRLRGLISPPIGTIEELSSPELIHSINQLDADIIFVVLGCPKQEQWMAKNSERINSLLIGVGAAIPVYCGSETRAPLLLRQLYLEWFYRFLKSPKRLFYRYWVYNPIYIISSIIYIYLNWTRSLLKSWLK